MYLGLWSTSMSHIRFALALALFSGVAQAQQAFTTIPAVPADVIAQRPFVRPTTSHIARVDWAALQQQLAQAPDEFSGNAPIEMMIPMPNGSLERFRVVESSVMEPGLEVHVPGMKTYLAHGIDDAAAVMRFDVSQFGFRAIARTTDGSVFIDPYSAGNREYIASYYLKDLPEPTEQWSCSVGPEHGAGQPHNPDAVDNDVGEHPFDERAIVNIRTYRFAMACTGEYGAYQCEVLSHAPNSADPLAAIVTITNRLNLIFENDIGVRFLLVSNNNLLAFFDPNTDPYPNADPACTVDPAADCSAPYLGPNQTAVDNIIGVNNYDVGHLLTRVRGGVANLNAPCGGNKARGISGIPRGGEESPISALVPAHELGHQFGANHTFNGVLGRCAGNINSSTSWEPGGGSTILSYPGACPVGGGLTGDNIVIFADTYFHAGSILEMRNFLASPNSQCSVPVVTTNNEPVIVSTTVDQLSIPPSTPFKLTATISDDSLNVVCNWDQYNAAEPRALGAPDPGVGPLFRSYPPAPSTTRYFPNFPSLLAGATDRGEQYPTFTPATRRFRFVARDNQGGIAVSPNVRVNISGTTPFAITQPTASSNFRGTPVNVTWTVGATGAAPFNVSTVTIKFSNNDGQTWSTITSSTPNDGAHSFSVTPTTDERVCRVMVEANGNIFFALSPAFAVPPPCDSIDFNNDGSLFDPQDIDALLSVYSEGPCIPANANCNDIDFNNDTSIFDPCDIGSFLQVYSEGPCVLCP